MSWIKIISYDKADASLKKLYDQVKGPQGNIDNIITVHSLRPHTMTGHLALYRNVLHHSANTLPKWYLEALGVYASHLNNCSYCVDHHSVGMKKAIGDEKRAEEILQCISADKLSNCFSGRELEGLNYARKLTLAISEIAEADVIALRKSGFTDGEILEINQVVSYFNYANRTALGLGVNTEGDILGTSPSA